MCSSIDEKKAGDEEMNRDETRTNVDNKTKVRDENPHLRHLI